MALNPHDPRMPEFTNRELHWKRCKTARTMYLQSGAELWIDMGRAAGCAWSVGFEGAQLSNATLAKSKPQFAPLAVAATAIVFSGIALMAGRQ